MADTVILRKANRQLVVDKKQANSYLVRGYDQVDEEGNVVKRATGGKTITVQEHNKVLDELEELKAQQEENSDDAKDERIEELEQELEETKKKAKEFAEKGKALQEENNKLKNQQGNKNKNNKS